MASTHRKFKGYVEFPLMGAVSEAHFKSMLREHGDFADPELNGRIYKRPRLYSIETHMVSSEGLGVEVVETKPERKITKGELTDLIKLIAKSHLKSLRNKERDPRIDARKSFIRVTLL